MVGKIIQGSSLSFTSLGWTDKERTDLLKLSEETDLDVLNHMMEVMVEQYCTELLPVASQLTARLV